MYGKVSRVSSHLIQFRVPALSEEAGYVPIVFDEAGERRDQVEADS